MCKGNFGRRFSCSEVLNNSVGSRHRYRNVETNSFGLSTEEVLSAPDKELNAWCSLRKTCSYRADEEERRDVAVFRGKGKNFELKKKVLPSLTLATAIIYFGVAAFVHL